MEQVGGEYGLILRGRRRSRLSSTPGQSPTALGRFGGITKKTNEPALIDHACPDRNRERKLSTRCRHLQVGTRADANRAMPRCHRGSQH